MPGGAGRYARTLRYTKPWQVLGRILAPARRRYTAWGLPEYSAAGRPGPGLSARIPFPQHEPWNSREAIVEGIFTFLNRSERLGWPPVWSPRQVPLLWLFNLHYFNYLHLLHASERAEICADWIARNPVSAGAAWHPYPTSLRIVNWCKADLDGEPFEESLYHQAAYLRRNLETHVYGNHLIENARALVFAGAHFSGKQQAAGWMEKGVSMLRAEAAIQILPDGGHYERSPMYHSLVLGAYADVVNVLPQTHEHRAELQEIVARMSDALVTLRHADGSLALFNDSTREIALPVDTLLDYARSISDHSAVAQRCLPEMGYYVLRDSDARVIMDGGSPGPDHLMAHAHADALSYELYIGDQPIVVDAGVYEYESGEMRDYVRSTRAHNTLTIDGQDQIECWGSFRVGRRDSPRDIQFEAALSTTRFIGCFDGYGRSTGSRLSHRRQVVLDRSAREMVVEDEVTGEGRHLLESRVHFHPDVIIEESETGVVLIGQGIRGRLMPVEGQLGWEEGWYCPRFGERIRTRVAVLRRDGTLPGRLSYRIAY